MIINLGSLGINWKGEFKCKNIGRQLDKIIPITQKTPDSNLWINRENKKLEFIKEVDRGSYGRICLCRRWTEQRGEHYVFTKIFKHTSKRMNESFIKEAVIQKLVANCLQEHGFERGCPDVFDIFKLYDGTICFSMEMFYGSERMDTFIKKFDKSNIVNFTSFIIELIVQIVIMLDILQNNLGLNHRDLNTSNILIQKQSKYTSINLEQILNKKMSISTRYYITIIDFGISCMGCNVQLGSIYPINDLCPKPGRDIFLFITLFFCDFGKYIVGPLRYCFKKWIEKDYGGTFSGRKLWKFLNRFEKSDYWIYWLSSQSQIQEFPYFSASIIKDLEGLG
jgi:serine/threonine protein kinase